MPQLNFDDRSRQKDRRGRPTLVVGRQHLVGCRWPLLNAAKTTHESDAPAICRVAFAPTCLDTLLSSVPTGFSLSPSEAKLAISSLQHDSLEDAAQAIGITETTANGYRKNLFRKVGVKRRGELMALIIEIAHRERHFETGVISEAIQEMFGLSGDQMSILAHQADNCTIPEPANIVNISMHTAHGHIKTMCELVGVNKQNELMRVAIEYSALRALSQASEVNGDSVLDLLSNTQVIPNQQGELFF